MINKNAYAVIFNVHCTQNMRKSIKIYFVEGVL